MASRIAISVSARCLREKSEELHPTIIDIRTKIISLMLLNVFETTSSLQISLKLPSYSRQRVCVLSFVIPDNPPTGMNPWNIEESFGILNIKHQIRFFYFEVEI